MKPKQDSQRLRNIAARFVAGAARLGDAVTRPEVLLVEVLFLASRADVGKIQRLLAGPDELVSG